MNAIKRALSVLLIAATCSVALPARQANAGIILLPFGIGVLLVIMGAVYNDAGLLLLDADGNVKQDALESALAKKYSFIDDRAVVSNLALAIREKAASAEADKNGQKIAALSRAEVLNILAPTGLVELDPAAVEQVISDLQ